MAKDRFIVAVASRAVFDLEAEHAVFEAQGPEAYARLQAEREDVLPAPGSAFGFVEGLARINAASPDASIPLVDIVVVSRNAPSSGLRFLNAVAATGLGATRAVMTGGRDVDACLAGLGVDLFVTRSPGDGAMAAAAGIPTAVLSGESPYVPFDGQLRLAFDGDAVLFDDASELAFREGGYDGWHAYEAANAGADLGPGPLDRFARKLSALREAATLSGVDLRIALVTARDGAARRRAVTSLRKRGIALDEAFFLGGLSKGDAMRSFRPHLFLDDKAHNVAAVSSLWPSALVPALGGPERASEADSSLAFGPC